MISINLVYHGEFLVLVPVKGWAGKGGNSTTTEHPWVTRLARVSFAKSMSNTSFGKSTVGRGGMWIGEKEKKNETFILVYMTKLGRILNMTGIQKIRQTYWMFDRVYPINMIYSTTYPPTTAISRSPAFTHYSQTNALYDSWVVRSHDGSSGFF